MNRLAFFAPLIACFPALGANLEAQIHLSLTEVHAGTLTPVPNPNGILEPGEAALVRLSISFAPPVGTIVGPGNQSVHALAGWMSFRVDVLGAAGEWSDAALAPNWTGHAGWPGHATTIMVISIAQEAEGADQSNPVENIWQAVWTPGDYASRSITVRASPAGFVPHPPTIWLRESGHPVSYTETHVSRMVSDVLTIVIEPDPPGCYANCDGSTVEPILNVDDFTCFINEFASAQVLPLEQQIEHYANCDGSMQAPILTVDDFTCFINAFAAGCP